MDCHLKSCGFFEVAQFDVHLLANGSGLVLDCQSDLLAGLDSRFVVPLVARVDGPSPARRLNPTFVVAGEERIMLTQSAAAIHKRELGRVIASLSDQDHQIIGALDVLLTGV
jgi:toxin CcdB